MKVRIEQERIAPGEDPEFHLKLGRGSLADIEFTVQLLQLRHRVPEPRRWRHSRALVEAGHLPADEAEVLEEAYRFCERPRNRTFLVVGCGRFPAHPSRADHAGWLARSATPSPSSGRTTGASPGGLAGSWSGASTISPERVCAMMRRRCDPRGPGEREMTCRCIRR